VSSERDCPLIVQIREDRPAGVIRAFFALSDEKRFEVATLSMGLAEDQPDTFRQWVEVLKGAITKLIQAHGIEVLRTFERRPHESN
jgi:hypothetical protein